MAIGGITIREERAKVGAFGAPLVRTGKQALMRCEDTERFPDWQSIEASARLVANLGGGNERFAKAHFAAASVHILETNEAVPIAVRDGEADVFFTDGPEASLLARTHETLCIGLGGKLYEPFELALWFAPGKSDLRADVARYLDSPVGRKHLRELRSRYQLP
jgi:cyclohexadienyl dehydratase